MPKILNWWDDWRKMTKDACDLKNDEMLVTKYYNYSARKQCTHIRAESHTWVHRVGRGQAGRGSEGVH